MKAIALHAAPVSRLGRVWQVLRREAKRALMLHIETCGAMAELYRRSGR